MSLHTSVIELNKEAIKEALYAAELLIKFRKNSDWNSSDKNDNGCLGYPAAILLFAYIDAAGCIFFNKQKGHSFTVLRTELFDSQKNLSDPLCLSLYTTYRNKLVHNLVLPKEAFLQIDINSKEPFGINPNGKKGKPEINSINLFALLEICKKSYIKLEKIIDERLMSATHIKDLPNYDLKAYAVNVRMDATPSGDTNSVSALSHLSK